MKFVTYFIILGFMLAIIGCQLEKCPELNYEFDNDTAGTRATGSGFRGTNMPGIWWESDSLNAYSAVSSNGFNAVRIVWETKGSASSLSTHISRAKSAGLSVMVELHDVTGSDSTSDLSRMADYWCKSDVRQVLSSNSDVMVNIANEWGSHSLSDSTWYDAYRSAIQKMRNAGISNTIVVDASGWGQNESPILNYGQSIMSVDSNVVLDLHMYGSWNDPSKISSTLSQIKGLGLPLIVGEFGYNYNNGSNNLSCRVDAATVMSSCKSNGFGYLAYQAEDQATNTGVYLNGSCGGSYSEWLHCNGYIEFGSGGSNPTGAPTPVPTATSAPNTTSAPTSLPTSAPTTPPSGGGGSCTSGTPISPGFSYDGAGEYCWEATSITSYINSWNLDVLEVNGVDFTNKWAGPSNLPAKIDGKYYIYYKSSVSYGHFEMQ